MEKTTEELYKERDKRISDAIELKIPDRVPVLLSFGYFPAKYTGITCQDAWYDFDKWLAAYKKTVVDFAPDGLWTLQAFSPGAVMEYINPKQSKWPGHGVSPNYGHQAIELEAMKSDEYDYYFNDRSDFILRTLLPRTAGVMEPFKTLPPISSLGFGSFGAMILGEALARPEVAQAIEILQKAGREFAKIRPKMATFGSEIKKLGFPINDGPGGGAPFDGISDFLRGMHGAMLDMYRQPEKLLELCEKQLSSTLERINAMPPVSGHPRAFMALHRGSDGFMSLKQFETFYWPSFKKVVLAMIDKGIVPCPFFEGIWDARLEYLLEFPKGKVLCHFAQTNMFKAKEVLGGHLCIMGDVPSTLLQAGTVQDVKDYCKKLIDVCGKDGGYILTNMPIDFANPENIKAMVDFTKEYGVYR
jgi:hypothetical protein